MQELKTNTMLDLGATELEDMEAPDFWGGFAVGVGSAIAAAGAAAAIVALT
ncbi:hypothetical protein [Curtobacterium sp. NPDC088465]|uniref:hypothetical protein n=1 Tax=unclassified Curtobacterium TaxID=257496 RepID=UPI003815F749